MINTKHLARYVQFFSHFSQDLKGVLDNDDVKALSTRILALEHSLYPRVVRLIAEGRVAIVNERATIDGKHHSLSTISNPSQD